MNVPKSVELSSGITATDRVIQSPPDGIATGDSVRVADAAPADAKAAPQAGDKKSGETK